MVNAVTRNGGAPMDAAAVSARLRAGHNDFEGLVYRLQGVGHVHTRRGSGDRVGIAVLLGFGVALRHTRLIAEASRR